MTASGAHSNAGLFDIADRVACVTGASGGIGRAAASALVAAGARVIGVARRRDRLAIWQQEADGQTAIVVADLANKEVLSDVVNEVAAPFGNPEILINAAGINTRQVADDVTVDDWNRTIDLNLATPFFLAQALAPAMKENGWGRILNFASLQSRRAFKGGLSYGASKGGVEQMTRAMAEAWSSHGITVNALAPGFFPTELTEPVFADRALAAQYANQTCIGRNGVLSDLIGPILFFCSDASGYVTGQTLFVDGGFTAK
ncbi:MAG: SDR family oxidoreductase [Rhodospirillaceae bacterium]|nr:SDR family oxidoreductase [Rhodospirillaceae bacterium]